MSKKIREEDMVQKVIDLETGEDITARYISKRLVELEELANTLIDGGVELLAGDWDGRQCPARWIGSHQMTLEEECTD